MKKEKYTVQQWIDLYKKIPGSVKLNQGISRVAILAFLEENGFTAPEEYIQFMELTNGATLFNGKVNIWKIPNSAGEEIPNWKSITYMNSEKVKKTLPDTEGVFLIGGNYLGDYIGISMNDKEFDLIYICPETDESWNYRTFTDWLDELWEEMGN